MYKLNYHISELQMSQPQPSSSSSSSTHSLATTKETLEKMLQAIQEELQKVDSEWSQLCSIANEQAQGHESRNKPVSIEFVKCDGLDDPNVVNELDLQL